MVQSARVQQIVKGDDVVMRHQLMGDVAFSAEASRAPVLLATGDTVQFFYPLADLTLNDLIGYPGVAVGSFPTSSFTCAIPGVIPATNTDPARGTQVFQAGPARTVRAEITRLKASPTGDTAIGSAIIANLSSPTGIVVGASISGAGIPARTTVISVGSTTLVMSANAIATAAGVSLTIGQKETHYLIQEVDISERGFPSSLTDTSGGVNPPAPSLNLT